MAKRAKVPAKNPVNWDQTINKLSIMGNGAGIAASICSMFSGPKLLTVGIRMEVLPSMNNWLGLTLNIFSTNSCLENCSSTDMKGFKGSSCWTKSDVSMGKKMVRNNHKLNDVRAADEGCLKTMDINNEKANQNPR